MIPDLVVFDLAGTTLEACGQVPDAFAAALAERGVSVSAEQIRRARGASKRHAIQQLIPSGPTQARLAGEVYAAFIRQLKERFASGGVREITGAADVFRRLRARGVRVALNTGFDREVAVYLLTALGWENGTVDALVCGDEVAQGRPAPDMIFTAMRSVGAKDPRRVANVGDTVLDLEAGFNAGVGWNIGVLSGAHDRASLESVAWATQILPSVAEVAHLFGAGES